MIKTFYWQGISENGTRSNGVITATHIHEVQTILNQKNIIVLKISRRYTLQWRKKINRRHIADLSREFATLLQAGIPLNKTLSILIDSSNHEGMKQLLVKIQKSLEEGQSLSQTLRGMPHYFDELYIGLLHAAEQSGTQSEIFGILAEQQERVLDFKNKIAKALLYPILVLVVAILITLGLLIFVIPQFQNVYQGYGAKMPPLTAWIIDVSILLRKKGGYVLIFLCLFFFFMKQFIFKLSCSKKLVDRIVLTIPFLNSFLISAIIARLTLCTATMTQSGVPLSNALQTALSILKNTVYQNALHRTLERIEAGESFASALQSTHYFPRRVTQMIAIGENSGTLPTILKKISETYFAHLEYRLDHLSKLLEPVIMLLLAVMIGTLIIAMYLPIFKIGAVF